MSADINTIIKVYGNRTEIESVINTVKYYINDMEAQYESERNCDYLLSATISDTEEDNDTTGKDVMTVTSEDIDKYAESKFAYINAEGPYGVFDTVADASLFTAIADATPTATIEIETNGFTTGADEAVKAELKDGIMKVLVYYEANEAFSELLEDLIDIEELCEKTGINEDYIDLITDIVENEQDYTAAEYEGFVVHMNRIAKSCKLDDLDISEEQFNMAIEFIKKAGVPTYDQYIDSRTWDYEFTYNPATKEKSELVKYQGE